MSRCVCARCTRPAAHCVCALIPSLASRTRITLLQHPDESRHALNTGRLVALGLQQARLLVGETFAPDTWAGPDVWLLFPGDGARTVGCLSDAGRERIRHLVVPDGTWRMARKLLVRNPSLAVLPRLVLPVGEPSRYRVRNAHREGAVATLEAVVRTLNMLEAPACFDALLAPFEAMVDAQLGAMAAALRSRSARLSP